MSHLIQRVLALSTAITLALSTASGTRAQEAAILPFALIGDLGYTPEQELGLVNVLAELNQHELAFVIHDGDLGGSQSCLDETYAQRLDQFQSSVNPLIFTPGDNDWTDCYQGSRGRYDPLERLAAVRSVFFPDGNSLGQRQISLTRQSENPRYRKFSENARWTYGGVLLATVHVVGSQNNTGRNPASDEEYAERNAANLAWIREAFQVAKASGSRAILIDIQANPNFDRPAGDRRRVGFEDTIAILAEESLQFDKPVVLVHGDSHYFRIDKPLMSPVSGRRIENFTRVETFGQPDHHWLLAEIDPSDPNVFVFRQRLVAANLVDHSIPAAGGSGSD